MHLFAQKEEERRVRDVKLDTNIHPCQEGGWLEGLKERRELGIHVCSDTIVIQERVWPGDFRMPNNKDKIAR